MLKVQNVTKIYGKNEATFTALDDITIDIPDGSVVAIVGKSGSGKSTLMHVMSGLDHPTEGEVIVNGKNLKRMKRRDLDRFRSNEMGFIFQSFFVQGNETCYDNVALPLEVAEVPRRLRSERIDKALESVELSEKSKQKARNLSGGQKQRLAIARAIVGEPKILFADEPTGNLDSVTSETIERLLLDYAREHKATLIVVTHDQDLADKCDMQIHMKDGKIERIDGINEGDNRHEDS